MTIHSATRQLNFTATPPKALAHTPFKEMLLAKRFPQFTPFLGQIEVIRNWSSLVLATTVYPLFLAGYTDLCSAMVFIYFFLDIPFIGGWDIFVHHIAAVMITVCGYQIQNHAAVNAVIDSLFRTELSTIFLTLFTLSQQGAVYLPPQLESAVKYAFMAAFLKFRTWDFTISTLQVRPLQIMAETGHYSLFEVPLGYLGVLTILALNLYWTVLILKKAVRMVRPQGIREIKSS